MKKLMISLKDNSSRVLDRSAQEQADFEEMVNQQNSEQEALKNEKILKRKAVLRKIGLTESDLKDLLG